MDTRWTIEAEPPRELRSDGHDSERLGSDSSQDRITGLGTTGVVGKNVEDDAGVVNESDPEVTIEKTVLDAVTTVSERPIHDPKTRCS